MSNLSADVDELVAKQTAWLHRGNPATADEIIGNEMQAVRAKQATAGLLVSEDRFTQEEDTRRQAFDRQTAAEGDILQIEARVLRTAIAEAIAAAEELHPLSRQQPMGTERFFLSAVLDELQQQRAVRDLAGLTRGQVLDLYGRLSETQDCALARAIEGAAAAGTWERLGLRDDPATDAATIPKLLQAVRSRRTGRVPAALREAQAKAARLNSASVSTLLAHLSSGRGVARRPRPMMATGR